MGFRQAMGRFLGLPARRFSDDQTPRPIDRMVWEMAGGGLHPTIPRLVALSVPAVVRGRNLICSIATLPLCQYGPDMTKQRLPLLEQIDPDIPNVVTLAQTVEDLLMVGESYWRITGFGSGGFPVSARHLDYSSVWVQAPTGRTPAPLPSGIDPRSAIPDLDGAMSRGARVFVDGVEVDWSELIRFDSPNPGLLNVSGGRTVRRAVLLDRVAQMYAENPRPLDYFVPAEGADPAEDDEVADILRKWAEARRKRSTAYVPAALKYMTPDQPTPADLQLVELQRQVTLDIANLWGLDPEDFGVSTTSRTYQNAIDRRQDRINETFAPYMRAITDRLSMGDVTRRGYSVRFELGDYLKADPKSRAEIDVAYLDARVDTVDEVRERRGLAPLTPAQKAELQPAPAPAPAVVPDIAAQPTAVQNSGRHLVALSAPGHTFMDISTAAFSVDVEKRTVEGIVLPYGSDQVAQSFWRKFRFQPGALQHSQDSRVKLLRDHDYSQPLGRLIHSEDRPEGRFARFKVASGPEGDRALALASEGVLDGFSVGVDFADDDTIPDPENKGVTLVRRADWRETSLTPMPAFDDARVTKVAASRDGGSTMPDTQPATAEGTAPAVEPAQTTTAAAPAPQTAAVPTTAQASTAPTLAFSADQFNQLLASLRPEGGQNHQPTAQAAQAPAQPADEARQVVNPTRSVAASAVTREEMPYRFGRGGNLTTGAHEFSTDVFAMARAGRGEPVEGAADARTRVEQFMRAQFDVAGKIDTTDVTSLNPVIQRPDLFVDQKSFLYPFYTLTNKGTLADGTPFIFPVFASSSGLVGAHTEGTEPTPGDYKTSATTVTPSALSGKVQLTREVYDAGGNPQVSDLIWRAMQRGWYEALEAAVVTVLNNTTLTAQTITLTTAATGTALTNELEGKLAQLNFARGGFTMRDFLIQADLFALLVGATDTTGRKVYPIQGATNANGTVSELWGAINIAGVRGAPAWALAAAGQTNPASSYLIDADAVSFWASAPQRLSFEYQVATIDMGIWGYKAGVVNDVTGVRKISYDPA